jgi:hypothetical protein
VLTKAKRFEMFLQRLDAAPPASSAEEALSLLAVVLNAVEDEHSETPNNPQTWKDDGRMYPPQEDKRRTLPDRPSLCRYRSAKHYTFIGTNGAIQIQTLDEQIIFDKAGHDRRKVSAL